MTETCQRERNANTKRDTHRRELGRLPGDGANGANAAGERVRGGAAGEQSLSDPASS